MITAGIDCGAKNTKTVILKNGEIIGMGSVLTGFDPHKAALDALNRAIQASGISTDAVDRIIGTGSGSKALRVAADTIDEIIAISRAAHFYFPSARTVVDVGAEEGRAAKIDENGEPLDFAINEKCAAGAGVFIEAMARALEVTVEEMGSLGLESDKNIPMNAQCAVFAESEIVGLIHANTPKADISRAVHDAMAGRIVSLIRRIGVNKDVVVLGGVGRNSGFMASLKCVLNLDIIYVPEAPEFGAATGAAVIAAEKA